MIRNLASLRRTDIDTAGGKGANLGELTALGLPVPNGFVITAPAYTDQTRTWGLAERLRPLIDRQEWTAVEAAATELLLHSPIDPALESALLAEYRRMGSPAVAVRSSATAEDLADASFAGQQETFLNVAGEPELLHAVRTCWASLWGARALHYRHQRAIDHLQVAMAVVVQTMVDADAAGVLFTVDPVTRRTDLMLLEAAGGLGEAVVSGDVTGDLYRVDRSGSQPAVAEREVRQAGRPVLTDGQVLELARLGLRLEAHFGCPQDVEFAVAGGQVWLLQARPITTLTAAAEPEELPPPTVLDPMQRRFLAAGQERYPLAPRPLDNLFWGIMVGAVTGAFRDSGFAVPVQAEEELVAQVWRDVYAGFPAGARPTWKLLKSGGAVKALLDRDWQGWWDAGPARELEAVSRPVPLHDLTDSQLLDRAEQIRQIWTSIFRERFRMGPALTTDKWLEGLVALTVGRTRAPRVVSDLMAELHTRTTEVNEALWQLSRTVRQEPAVAAAVASGEFNSLAALPGGPEVLMAFDRFLAQYGHREGTTWYLSTPTWRQERSQVWRLLQGLVAVAEAPAGAPGRYGAARALVGRRLRFMPPLRRAFEWLTDRLRALQLFRENSHFDLTRPLAALQEVAAEWGRRLTERGLLSQPEDVFDLTYAEVRQWLTGGAPAPADARLHIARRKATYALVAGRWQAAHFWPAGSEGAVVRGVAASAGTVRARVRIIRSEADWGKLQPGEVMVCPYTNPAWTPLFAVAAAVVTETGGAAAHAAIVAREYGIPAVMGVPGATSRLQDGQEVLVNGDTGVVMM